MALLTSAKLISDIVQRSKAEHSVCVPYCIYWTTAQKYIFNKYFKAAQWKLVKIVTWYIIECEMRKERETFCLGPRRVKVKIEIFHFFRLCHFYSLESVDVKLSMGYYGCSTEVIGGLNFWCWDLLKDTLIWDMIWDALKWLSEIWETFWVH